MQNEDALEEELSVTVTETQPDRSKETTVLSDQTEVAVGENSAAVLKNLKTQLKNMVDNRHEPVIVGNNSNSNSSDRGIHTETLLPNSFIREVDGKPRRFEDPLVFPDNYQEKIDQLQYEVQRVGSRQSVYSFEGKKGDGKVVIRGETLAAGAERNAMLVTDSETGQGWVMYSDPGNSEPVGGTTTANPLNEKINLPIDGVYNGAYRYLPLENELTVFPSDFQSGKHATAKEMVNRVASLLYPPYWAGEVYKIYSKQKLEKSGLVGEELHGGNLKFAVWDKKPKEGFVMPLPRFKWKIDGDRKVLRPGISWATMEVVEYSVK